MKEIKKIRLTDSPPPSKEVKKYKLEPINKNGDLDSEKKDFYDSYDGIKNDLYRPGE